jgi:hypothetical protein
MAGDVAASERAIFAPNSHSVVTGVAAPWRAVIGSRTSRTISGSSGAARRVTGGSAPCVWLLLPKSWLDGQCLMSLGERQPECGDQKIDCTDGGIAGDVGDTAFGRKQRALDKK